MGWVGGWDVSIGEEGVGSGGGVDGGTSMFRGAQGLHEITTVQNKHVHIDFHEHVFFVAVFTVLRGSGRFEETSLYHTDSYQPLWDQMYFTKPLKDILAFSF